MSGGLKVSAPDGVQVNSFCNKPSGLQQHIHSLAQSLARQRPAGSRSAQQHTGSIGWQRVRFPASSRAARSHALHNDYVRNGCGLHLGRHLQWIAIHGCFTRVQVYTVSGGKSVPAWLSDKKKRKSQEGRGLPAAHRARAGKAARCTGLGDAKPRTGSSELELSGFACSTLRRTQTECQSKAASRVALDAHFGPRSHLPCNSPELNVAARS